MTGHAGTAVPDPHHALGLTQRDTGGQREEEEEEEEEEKKKTEEGKNISVKEITEIGLFNVFSLSMKPTELNIGGKDAAERCERIC